MTTKRMSRTAVRRSLLLILGVGAGIASENMLYSFCQRNSSRENDMGDHHLKIQPSASFSTPLPSALLHRMWVAYLLPFFLTLRSQLTWTEKARFATATAQADSCSSSTAEVGKSIGIYDVDLDALPHSLQTRFLRYARRDSKTGEFILTLPDFFACMLLLSPPSSAPASWTPDLLRRHQNVPPEHLQHQQLSSAVQRRLVNFFHSVDVDGTSTINYAEFVLLFTFLSTQQQTLRRAFSVFDLDENGRLNEVEFTRLINTIMIDPSVQVTLSMDEAASRDTASFIQPCEAIQKASGSANSSDSTRIGEESTGAFSIAGVSPRAKRDRRRHGRDLTFELPSRVMRYFLYGPLPRHIAAPPGSVHHCGATEMIHKRTPAAAAAAGSPIIPAIACDMEEVPHRHWWDFRVAFRAPHEHQPEGARRFAELQEISRRDEQLRSISYANFSYRVDYLRWELRAIEFGIFDPANSGVISVEDCRRILCLDGRSLPCAKGQEKANRLDMSSSGSGASGNPSGAVLPTTGATQPQEQFDGKVTWQMYQKIFDIIKVSELTLPALQLALDATPPVPASTLVGGAIPEDALESANTALQRSVQQFYHYHHAGSHPHQHLASSTAKVPDDRGAKRSLSSSDDLTTPAAVATTDATPLVRASALNWHQVCRALNATGAVPLLNDDDRQLLQALFSSEGPAAIKPMDFGRLCDLRNTFFAQALPQFGPPRRNLVQQFFFCMQQLE